MEPPEIAAGITGAREMPGLQRAASQRETIIRLHMPVLQHWEIQCHHGSNGI